MKLYKFFTLGPILLLMAAIFIESSQPSIPFIDQGFIGMDKVLHYLAFIVLGCLLQLAFYGNFKSKNIVYWVILIGALYGLSDEYHQSFVPGRDSDLYDFLADVLGIFTSLFLSKRIKKIVVFLQVKFVEKNEIN